MYTLLIILGVILALLGITFVLLTSATTFNEKFGRKFIFAKTFWGILIGGIIIFLLFFETGVSSRLSTCWSSGELFTFGSSCDANLGFLLFGLIIIFWAWGINISKSNFVWGMWQNIVQTIIVLMFSVIIVIGAMFVKDILKKKK